MQGSQMKEIRRIIGLTQAEVAQELGVNKQTVHRWEKGKCRIKRSVEGSFAMLANSPERISWIKSNRPKRVRGVPFKKKNS